MLIPKNRLEVLYPHSKKFQGLGVSEWECLFSSVLGEGSNIENWLQAAGEVAEEVLFKIFRSSSEERSRKRIVRCLASRRTPRTLEFLIAALKDEDPLVREAVAEELDSIGDTTSVQALIAALAGEDDRVRWKVAVALIKIGDPASIQPLVIALESLYPDREVGKAVEILGISDSVTISLLKRFALGMDEISLFHLPRGLPEDDCDYNF